MNEKVDVEIARRQLTVEIDGLTPIEISALARTVDEKMSQIFQDNPNMADSSKTAILAALSFAADAFKIERARDADMRTVENKVERMNLALQGALPHE